MEDIFANSLCFNQTKWKTSTKLKLPSYKFITAHYMKAHQYMNFWPVPLRKWVRQPSLQCCSKTTGLHSCRASIQAPANEQKICMSRFITSFSRHHNSAAKPYFRSPASPGKIWLQDCWLYVTLAENRPMPPKHCYCKLYLFIRGRVGWTHGNHMLIAKNHNKSKSHSLGCSIAWGTLQRAFIKR